MKTIFITFGPVFVVCEQQRLSSAWSNMVRVKGVTVVEFLGKGKTPFYSQKL